MNKLVLSVDWDFFFPSAQNYWLIERIQEEKYYLKDSWEDYGKSKGKKIVERFKMEEGADDFWKWLSEWFIFPKEVLVSESHMAMRNLISTFQELILFDSHHDCYWLRDNYDCNDIDCGRWGSDWLFKNKDAKMIWFSQENRNEAMDTQFHKVKSQILSLKMSDAADVFDRMYFSNRGKLKLEFLHICRSGCWSPPQFDGAFIKFVNELGSSIKIIPDFLGINPLIDRLTEPMESWL